jgi:adenine-specific DNA-methyltransferase
MPDYEKLSREELIRVLMERDGEDLGGIQVSSALTPPARILPSPI